jgi:peptidyl-tRNA hydrolase
MQAEREPHTEYWYSVWYLGWYMETLRKITVEVPEELLESAQKASREGVTQTVRAGLRLLAASEVYARAQRLRGKVKFSLTAEELKADR